MGELVPLIEQAAADNPGLAARSLAALALAHVEGRPHRRRASPAGGVRGRRTSIFRSDPIWLTGMVRYAEAAIACRDPKYAGPLLRPARPVGRSVVRTTGIIADGPVSHYLGGLATVLGRYDEADAYFTQAAAFNDRADAKFFAARTNLSWGKMLAERNGSGRHRKGSRPAHQGARPPPRPTATPTSNDAPPKHFSAVEGWARDKPAVVGKAPRARELRNVQARDTARDDEPLDLATYPRKLCSSRALRATSARTSVEQGRFAVNCSVQSDP